VEPPAINCPADITVSATGNNCDRKVNFNVTASDNCSLASFTTVPPSGATFPVGTNIVISTAIDASGNSNTCTFTVTVLESDPPVITCPSNITVNAASGGCSSNVTFSVTATDNCGVDSVVSVPPSGFSFPFGVTTVTNTAWDSSGNSNQCTFTVTVTN